MSLYLRHISLLRLPVAFPTSSYKYSKWVSTAATENLPKQSINPLDHLLVFSSKKQRKCTGFDRSVVSALKFSSSLQAISQGKQVHGLVLKSGIISNIFVLNSLISFYAKCGSLDAAELMFHSSAVLDSVSWNIILAGYAKVGNIDEAYRFFHRIPIKDSFSYTTIIMAFDQNGYWFQASEVYKAMLSAGVKPNEVTMASVISAYTHFGYLRSGQSLHAVVAKLGLAEFDVVLTNLVRVYCHCCSNLEDARILFNEIPNPGVVAWNVMLDGYSKHGHVGFAKDLFSRIPSKDVISFGTMISCYERVGKFSDALTTFRAMLFTGLVPNNVMLVDLILACGRRVALPEGQQFHCMLIKRAFDCYDFVQTTVIFFYASCYKIELALSQFDFGCKCHIPSWNAIISGFIRNGMLDKACELFNKMPNKDVFTWGSMISGYAQSENPMAALEVFHGMIAFGIQPNVVTMVSVVFAIASIGLLEYGMWVHEYIYNIKIPFNDYLCAALIDMYAKCGSIDRAVEFFNQIRRTVLSISPWNAIICGLAMHGHANLSLEIFSELEKEKVRMKPNSITFIGVLSACCHAGMIEKGRWYFKRMKSFYDVDPNLKHYGCMVDLLGRAGLVEEAEDLIKSMPMKAGVEIWGALLAACRNFGKVEIGERAEAHMAELDTFHGGSKVLLANMYADAGQWEDVFLVRKGILSHKIPRSSAFSGVV